MDICLAYDGSINGDWVARHAIRLAVGDPAQRLRVLHVETAELSSQALADKVAAIQLIAARSGVTAELEICPMHDGVVGGLVEYLGRDPNVLMVAGMRAQGGRRGFLAGTISSRLLNDTHFDVVSYRVVQPGGLGMSRRLLMPLAGHRPGHRAAIRLLALLAHDLEKLRMLHVVEVPTRRMRRMTAPDASQLRHRASAYLQAIENELRGHAAAAEVAIESAVRISDDWSRETIIDAAQQKVDLIALEASRLSLQRGFRYGDPFETLLRDAPCDVAIYRSGAQNGG